MTMLAALVSRLGGRPVGVVGDIMLDHFVIECVVESVAEPWFSEARVGTVVVSARICDDARERDMARIGRIGDDAIDARTHRKDNLQIR